ncbi:MAG TPA: hypothetical protein VES89_05840 [Candidatus Competibacteraceae bacterium]|nr:hypothetical protein [Candidatus Competibacteraceae bacterium]
MAFVRRRGNNTTLIETYREDGKVEQRIIANLYGQNSVAEALQELERQIAEHEQWLQRSEASRREPLFSIPAPPRYYRQDEEGREIPYYSFPSKEERRERKQREQLLKLEEALAMGLQTETFDRAAVLPATLIPLLSETERRLFEGRKTQIGANKWIWEDCQRVEINAIPVKERVDYLDRQLAKIDALLPKVKPPAGELVRKAEQRLKKSGDSAMTNQPATCRTCRHWSNMQSSLPGWCCHSHPVQHRYEHKCCDRHRLLAQGKEPPNDHH